MTLTEIVAEATKHLPFTSEWGNPVIRILILNEPDLSSIMGMVAPIEYDRPYYEVEFRKQYVNNIVIGWEFVALCNGI